jgi:hypothetical protein
MRTITYNEADINHLMGTRLFPSIDDRTRTQVMINQASLGPGQLKMHTSLPLTPVLPPVKPKAHNYTQKIDQNI